jgi:hypothetical protein
LPWSTYKQEITQVHLRLRFEPAKGSPLYAESAPITFKKDGVQVTSQVTHRVLSPLDQQRQQAQKN